MNQVAIIGSGGANFKSLQEAFNRLQVASVITNDRQLILNASHVVLPGVGAMGYAMNELASSNLASLIPELTQPVLGICLGLQLLCAYSEENNCAGLNIIPVQVARLKEIRIVPHMGWNEVKPINSAGILANLLPKDNVYFVHSYAAEVLEPYTQGVTIYGSAFSAYLRKDNFHALQFHPEKSGAVGEKILKNFLAESTL